jgi:hypothetical protein
MKKHNKQNFTVLVSVSLLSIGVSAAQASEIGHYAGGFYNIRDFFVPEKSGFYGALYNYGYTTNRLNNGSGDKIDSITFNNPTGGRDVTVGVSMNVDMYVLATTLMWVSDWKPLGAKYAALIAPSFANASLNAALSTILGRGAEFSVSSFDVGDMFIQPIWLDWEFKHFDVTLAYGLYAPIGKYHIQNATTPIGVPVRGESPSNIGYGFWTHQFQSAVAWYPFEHKGTAVTAALTYELHDQKKGFDLTPGENLTLNYGVSQFLPLTDDHNVMLELGVAGFSSWQISNDTGSAANPIKDQLHAVGGQLGLAYVPLQLGLTAHYFSEFSAKDRFQGQSFGISLAKKF